MLELFPGLLDVVIFGGGMVAASLLLVAYAVIKPDIERWRNK